MLRKKIVSLLLWSLLPMSGYAVDDVKTLLPIGDELEGSTGGALTVSDHPSRQELMDRAQYWDGRGRADLAAKLRAQYPLPESNVVSQPPTDIAPLVTPQPVTPPSVNPQPVIPQPGNVQSATPPAVFETRPVNPPTLAETMPTRPQAVKIENSPLPAPVVEAIPVKASPEARANYWQARGRGDLTGIADVRREVISQPAVVMPPTTTEVPVVQTSPQDLQARAEYWQARGRADLAEKLVNPRATASVKSAPSPSGVRSSVVLTGIKPIEDEKTLPTAPLSRQSLDENAQYWESRGRTDLAEQIRQQLQRSSLPENRVERAGVLRHDSEKIVNNQSVEKSSLEDSLLKNPNNLKARLDLAQIYRSTGELSKARSLIESVLASHPDMPEALLASALLFAEQHLWPETLFVLEKVAPVARNAEMAKLQKMAWAHVQLDRADALLRRGDNIEAELLLRRIAAELAINSRQQALPEPPALWNSAPRKQKKSK